jgi:hypothetical protein
VIFFIWKTSEEKINSFFEMPFVANGNVPLKKFASYEKEIRHRTKINDTFIPIPSLYGRFSPPLQNGEGSGGEEKPPSPVTRGLNPLLLTQKRNKQMIHYIYGRFLTPFWRSHRRKVAGGYFFTLLFDIFSGGCSGSDNIFKKNKLLIQTFFVTLRIG